MTGGPRGYRRRPVGRAGRLGQDGASAVEYTGVLAVVVVVIGALLLAVSPPQIAAGVRGLVCAVVGLGCDGGPGAPGADASGVGTSGPGGGGDDADSDAADDAAGTPPGAPSGAWCSGAWGCTRAGAAQVGSGVFNVFRGAYDDVAGIVGLVANPGQLVDAGRYIIENPLDAARQLVWDNESGDMWGSGDYGGAVGRTVWNIGSWFIPGVNAGRAAGVAGDFGRVARAATAAGRVVDDVADLARRASAAAARGNLDEAADLAGQARRRADDAAADARRAGCLTAGEAPARAVLVMAGPRRASVSLVAPVQSGGVRAAGCDPAAAAAAAEARRTADDASVAAGALAQSGSITSSVVRFSQDSVSRNFSDGSALEALTQGLRDGTVKTTDIPPIRLVQRDGRVYTLDNRRLVAYQQAGVDAPYRLATPQEIAREGYKFTTSNGGDSIRIRGEGGYEHRRSP